MESQERLMETYKKLVETKLGWGSSELWTNQDYERLSLRIQDATGVNLSAATLKRIWGKVRYESKPSTTTLNTLAQFAGFPSWRDYALQYLGARVEAEPVEFESKENASFISFKRAVAITISVVLLLGAIVFLVLGKDRSIGMANPDDFSFSARIISTGIPNTVVFDYDATKANDTDTIYIQQSWDPRLRTQISSKDSQHTSIYYHPGFFQAKLIVNSKAVKEHPLFIKTEGWLPMIDVKPVPVYLKEQDVRHNGLFGVSLDLLDDNNIPMQPLPPWVSYYYVNDFNGIEDDSIIFEANVRNEYAEGAAACQHTEIHLLFEGRALVIPLSAPGCVSELNFLQMEGTKHDLSALGVDFSKWVNVRIEIVNRKGKVFINGKDSFVVESMPAPAKLVGILFRFQGTGSVNDVSISRAENQTIFKETFDEEFARK